MANKFSNFRKKPVVIEAFKWEGGEVTGLKGVRWNASNGNIHPETLTITTLEGLMTAKVGDYIIRGIKGEIYPCKASIFKGSYEAVD